MQVFAVLIVVAFSTYRYLEYQAFQSRIQVGQIRNFITHVINTDLEKAVDVGIIEFSLWEGILVEDLVISQEEDFNFNKKLLQTRKIAIQLSSVFSSNPYIRKIKFIRPKIHLDQKDPFFSRLIEYLLKANIQEVEFQDAVVLYDNDSRKIIGWETPTKWVFKKRDNHIDFHFSNAWIPVPFFPYTKGSGSIVLSQTDEPKISMSAEWKNLPVDSFGGFVEWATLLDLDKGMMDGSMEIAFENGLWNLSNKLALSSVSGVPSFWPTDRFENWDLGTEFQSKISSTDKSEKQFHYTTKGGQATVQFSAEKSLYQGRIEWDVQDVRVWKEKFPEWSNIALQGAWKGEITWKETGVRNQWFVFQGESQWKDGHWFQDGLNLRWDNWQAKIQDNQWETSFNGSLFDSPLEWSAKIKLQFWKSVRPDKTNYYPMGSNGSIRGKLQELRITDWQPILKKFWEGVQTEIRERQEKLLPEEYFTQFKIYRYVLEEMNLDWSFQIRDFVSFATNQRIPQWEWNGNVKSARIDTKLQTLDRKNRVEFRSHFGTKTPTWEFTLNLDEFPWGEKILEICGAELMAQSLFLDYRLRLRGADISSLSKDASLSSNWKLIGAEFRDSTADLAKKIPIPGIGSNFSEPLTVQWDWDHYFEVSYFRNIETIGSDGWNWKGSGSTRTGKPAFHLYGKTLGEYRSVSWEEGEKSCP